MKFPTEKAWERPHYLTNYRGFKHQNIYSGWMKMLMQAHPTSTWYVESSNWSHLRHGNHMWTLERLAYWLLEVLSWIIYTKYYSTEPHTAGQECKMSVYILHNVHSKAPTSLCMGTHTRSRTQNKCSALLPAIDSRNERAVGFSKFISDGFRIWDSFELWGLFPVCVDGKFPLQQ